MNRRKNWVLRLVLAASLGATAVAAEAAPVRISACMTITQPGRHVLTDNLVAVGDCLLVDHDFVTIDFRGFSITGDGTGSGITNGVAGLRHGVTIRDGTISNFDNGIDFTASLGTTIERMRVIDNLGDGLHIGENARIIDSTVSGNGGFGIGTGSGAIITGNSVGQNGGDGVFTTHSVVTGNVARSNGGDGIRCLQRTTCTGNTLTFNDGDGIEAGYGSTVTGNTATFNDGDGIVAPLGSGNVSGNTVTHNGGDGIEAQCAAKVTGNVATDNGMIAGVNLLLAGNPLDCVNLDNLAP
jgi:hypothetical protein